eukprot:CAMPEP_0184506386 /NCGR_PEP_ID=MMETSP0113_2-20130426/53471_1 /TAXON_ID=91329 /ORGANISM="Norrisiella sphaerica, Strain BC52" /LENGTH=106 /DNA_ID=CAMNT_0026896101 /DNA_START=264 /DNA_END=584 /DNA_ORIENTATION=-
MASVTSSPGMRTGIPGGYGQIVSADKRPYARSVLTISLWAKCAFLGDTKGIKALAIGAAGRETVFSSGMPRFISDETASSLVSASFSLRRIVTESLTARISRSTSA